MASKSFVESTISDNKVAIFSKSYCPYCKRTKALFSEKFPDVEPAIIELDQRDDGSEIQDYIINTYHHRTVPGVFINKQLIGGNDDTQAAFKSGKLTELINA